MTSRKSPDWERYYIEQSLLLEEEKQRTKKKKQTSKKIVLIGCAVIALFVIKNRVSYLGSEYAQIIREHERGDYKHTKVQQKCAEYLNEKYGSGFILPEELNVNEWQPRGTASMTKWKCYKAYDKSNVFHYVTMIYLSANEVIFMDSFQWEEIQDALETEAIERTGLAAANVQFAIQSEESYSLIYADEPWISGGAYHEYFDGNLQSFFNREYEIRKNLKNADQVEKELRLCGAMAIFFADQNCPNLRTRMTNPKLDYAEKYQTAMLDMEEKYHIDILSSVLPEEYYLQLEEFYDHDEKSHYDLPVAYEDFGKGGNFFYDGYNLLSWAYDTLYTPNAREVKEGFYIAGSAGKVKMEEYEYREIEPSETMRRLMEEEYSGWTEAESFQITAKEIDTFRTAIILDVEKKYPGKEVVLLAEDYYHPAEACEAIEDILPRHFFTQEVMAREGYWFVPSENNWNDSYAYCFTVLVK